MSLVDGRILKDIEADDSFEDDFPGLHDALRRGIENSKPKPPPNRSHPPLDSIAPSKPLDPRGTDITRALLNAIRQYDEFKDAREKLSPEMKKQLDDFMEGKKISEILEFQGMMHHQDMMVPVSSVSKEHFEHLEVHTNSISLSSFFGGKKKEVKMATNVAFSNWGETVKNTPGSTYTPTKVSEIQAIVKQAKEQGKRVRASGYRHTWTDMYSQDNEILISMLDLEQVTTLPNSESLNIFTPSYPGNDFKVIELFTNPSDPTKALVRLGAAVTNEDFRRWAIKNEDWTLPINVIIVEITFGGSNAPICHGAGITSQTLSDLVRSIEYVDANGETQAVSDPKLLKAAAGCFGLLGIVTHITLELDQMSYACLDPKYPDLLLAIPPPKDFKFPSGCEDLQKRFNELTPQQLEDARNGFIHAAENNYYTEWFWFPYQSKAFVNCWNKTTDKKGYVNYPNAVETFAQWMSSWVGEQFINTSVFRDKSPETQAKLMSCAAMLTLPGSPRKTQLINALHFRRGTQNMRVGDFEVEIPIPAISPGSTTRNWELVQQAWWDGITAIYQDRKDVSARIALEMRITGDSAVVMAPQRGNTLGTASIEVITNMPAVEDKRGIWGAFKQRLASIWMAYKDEDGKPLNVRPHWAKEWTGTTVLDPETKKQKDWVVHMKEKSFHKEIPEFRALLEEIGKDKGWGLSDLKARFSTPLLDRLVFEE